VLVYAVPRYCPLTLTAGINIFIRDEIYYIKKYVYLVEMKNFYEWVLCVVCKGEFKLYAVSLAYYEDTHIQLHFDSDDTTAKDVEEFLSIELCEILDGDIRGYDAHKKTLYSPWLILEFQKQFYERNKSMKELGINYL
jgi:hypothetical protein